MKPPGRVHKNHVSDPDRTMCGLSVMDGRLISTPCVHLVTCANCLRQMAFQNQESQGDTTSAAAADQ